MARERKKEKKQPMTFHYAKSLMKRFRKSFAEILNGSFNNSDDKKHFKQFLSELRLSVNAVKKHFPNLKGLRRTNIPRYVFSAKVFSFHQLARYYAEYETDDVKRHAAAELAQVIKGYRTARLIRWRLRRYCQRLQKEYDKLLNHEQHWGEEFTEKHKNRKQEIEAFFDQFNRYGLSPLIKKNKRLNNLVEKYNGEQVPQTPVRTSIRGSHVSTLDSLSNSLTSDVNSRPSAAQSSFGPSQYTSKKFEDCQISRQTYSNIYDKSTSYDLIEALLNLLKRQLLEHIETNQRRDFIENFKAKLEKKELTVFLKKLWSFCLCRLDIFQALFDDLFFDLELANDDIAKLKDRINTIQEFLPNFSSKVVSKSLYLFLHARLIAKLRAKNTLDKKLFGEVSQSDSIDDAIKKEQAEFELLLTTKDNQRLKSEIKTYLNISRSSVALAAVRDLCAEKQIKDQDILNKLQEEQSKLLCADLAKAPRDYLYNACGTVLPNTNESKLYLLKQLLPFVSEQAWSVSQSILADLYKRKVKLISVSEFVLNFKKFLQPLTNENEVKLLLPSIGLSFSRLKASSIKNINPLFKGVVQIVFKHMNEIAHKNKLSDNLINVFNTIMRVCLMCGCFEAYKHIGSFDRHMQTPPLLIDNEKQNKDALLACLLNRGFEDVDTALSISVALIQGQQLNSLLLRFAENIVEQVYQITLQSLRQELENLDNVTNNIAQKIFSAYMIRLKNLLCADISEVDWPEVFNCLRCLCTSYHKTHDFVWPNDCLTSDIDYDQAFYRKITQERDFVSEQKFFMVLFAKSICAYESNQQQPLTILVTILQELLHAMIPGFDEKWERLVDLYCRTTDDINFKNLFFPRVQFGNDTIKTKVIKGFMGHVQQFQQSSFKQQEIPQPVVEYVSRNRTGSFYDFKV